MSRDSLKVPSERVGVAAAFLIHATVSGTWAPRLPAIKASLDLSAGMLGTALVGLAVGLLAGTRLAGAPVDRFGSRPVMRAGFPALCASLVLPALAGSAATLFLALLALGLASGVLDVAMNAQGVEVERHRRRPLLSGLHGLWSVGLGAGAGTAALAAAIGADPLRARVGAVALVRGGTLLAATGLLLGLAVHRPAAAIAGFTLLGAGLAPVVPIAFSAAGTADLRATGRNIGRVAGIGYVGSVSGPIIIGWLAQATSLRSRWASPPSSRS